MSLGSRLAKRGRAAVVNASFASTPREPLLFLYPAWARKFSSEAAAAATATATADVRNPTDSNTVQDVAEPPNMVRQRIEEFQAKQVWLSKRIIANDPSQLEVEKLLRVHTREEDNQNTPDGQDGLPNGPYLRKLFGARRVLKAALKEKPRGTVGTFEHARRVISRRTRHLAAMESNRLVRQTYQKERRARMHGGETWDPDWRVILGDLSKNTQQLEKWLDKAVSISVPQSAANLFLTGIDENLWELATRYGCILQMNPQQDGKRSSIVISGTKTSITRTATHILRIAPQSQLKLGAEDPEDSEDGSTRQISTSPGAVNPEGIQVGVREYIRFVSSKPKVKPVITRVDKVPKPARWTRWSFADYITMITSLRLPNHFHPLLYNERFAHQKITLNFLVDAFNNPEYENLLSREAFHIALVYCVRTTQMLHLRKLVFRMDMVKIPMNVETFNIMLRGCAKKDDLHNFHFILHMMLRRGIPPNENTWLLFVRAVENLRVKLYIFSQMKARGLVRQIRVVKAAVNELVTHEIEASLDNGQRQDEFLRHMESRYGEHWLTIESANKILNALGLRGMTSRCFDFLLYMREHRHCTPDQVAVNTVLHYLRLDENIAGAIKLLKILPPSIGFVPNQQTYSAFFKLAWKLRSYNLCKVIYKYACLHGCTDSNMRYEIFWNMSCTADQSRWRLRYRENWRLHPEKVFLRTAGYFITSTYHIHDHPVAVFRDRFYKAYGHGPGRKQFPRALYARNVPIPPKFRLKKKSSIHPRLIKAAYWDKLEKTSWQFARNFVKGRGSMRKYDWGMFQYFRPTVPFADMLSEAWERDKELNGGAWESEIMWKKMLFMKPLAVPIQSISPDIVFEMEWK